MSESMRVRGLVYRLLLEHGAYDPLELLIGANRLAEEDRRAWRSGARARLDGAFDNVGEVRAMLEDADGFATALGLAAEVVTRHGEEERVGVPLTASDDGELDRMLCTLYRPVRERRQLDLFEDSARTVAVKDLCDALTARDVREARRQRQRIVDLDPNDRAAAHAAVLIAALEASAVHGVAQASDRLGRIEREWLPAASALLGRTGRAFLIPLWREVADGFDDRNFDAAHPERHPSWAWRHCLDWEAVKRSVLAVPSCATQPVLLAALAEAEYRLHNRIAAVAHWFALCRLAPGEFADLVAAPDFPDRGMAQAWRQAVDADELDRDLTCEWFPAWMLVRERGLARVLPPQAPADDPARAFNLVRELQTSGDAPHGRIIELRAALQAVHPGLFRSYLATLT